MKKVKAKGTFCLRCWAVFCGWLNSITKHYAIINNEFHSSFLECVFYTINSAAD